MNEDKYIRISIAEQSLRLFESEQELACYCVSTAKNGPGEQNGSECTPRGRHRIAAKIGAGEAINTVFVARQPTGEIYSPALALEHPGRDWILTRILWLAGCEPGRNEGGAVDTFSRYIYLHGTPDTVELGAPGSRGCVRMRNAEIVALFDAVAVGTTVEIVD